MDSVYLRHSALDPKATFEISQKQSTNLTIKTGMKNQENTWIDLEKYDSDILAEKSGKVAIHTLRHTFATRLV